MPVTTVASSGVHCQRWAGIQVLEQQLGLEWTGAWTLEDRILPSAFRLSILSERFDHCPWLAQRLAACGVVSWPFAEGANERCCSSL